MIRSVFGAVAVPLGDRYLANEATALGFSLGIQDVVLPNRTGSRTELRIPSLPCADRTYGHGNPEQEVN